MTVAIGTKDEDKLPLLRNPPLLEATDDLTNLSYLNEPSGMSVYMRIMVLVLQNLRVRYASQNVYTYSGIVLIAMNPFARIPLYTNELIHAYSGKRKGELEPHLFAIGEEAYRGMIRDSCNQTVVISGER
jgi:myosin-5